MTTMKLYQRIYNPKINIASVKLLNYYSTEEAAKSSLPKRIWRYNDDRVLESEATILSPSKIEYYSIEK